MLNGEKERYCRDSRAGPDGISHLAVLLPILNPASEVVMLPHESDPAFIAPPAATTVGQCHLSRVDLDRNPNCDGPVEGTKRERKGLLDSEEWHRPYAEALIETDPVKLVPLIAKAERAILSRYLEMFLTRGPIEQSIDLKNAFYYLSQLKKGNRSVRPPFSHLDV